MNQGVLECLPPYAQNKYNVSQQSLEDAATFMPHRMGAYLCHMIPLLIMPGHVMGWSVLYLKVYVSFDSKSHSIIANG